MRVVIRTDSSSAIGTGHVTRCLTFANALRNCGATVTFVCRDHSGNIASEIADNRFDVRLLPRCTGVKTSSANLYEGWLGVEQATDAVQTRDVVQSCGSVDRLVVDHYGLDESWESLLRPSVGGILVIDDLANRRHTCSALLDQNLQTDTAVRYLRLVPADCRLLNGPRFALLREEFHRTRLGASHSRFEVQRILVFYGGVDATNETVKAMTALQTLNYPNLQITVIVGPANAQREYIHKVAADDARFKVRENVSDMARLMAEADLALGAGGTTTWERCCMGLPTIITAVAENQISIAEQVARAGAAVYLGEPSDVSGPRLMEAVGELLTAPARLSSMSERASSLVDGLGTSRVVRALYEMQAQEAPV